MKRHSNVARNLLVLPAVLAISVVWPLEVYALPTKTSSPFCTNLAATVAKVNGQMASLQAKLTSARTTRDNQLAANQSKWDSALEAARSKADAARQSNFAQLESKATTSAQKSAVQTYEAAVMSAVATRRAANDQARTTFRSALLGLLGAHRGQVDTQATAFSTAVKSAEDSATAACQATPAEGASIRATFQAAMKTARQTYITSRQEDSKLGSQIAQLAHTRDEAIKANDTAFLAATKSAREALKAAFASSATSPAQ